MKLYPAFLFLLFFLANNLSAQDCEEFEVAGESCQLAPFICDLEGYCSNNYTAAANGTPNAFCGQVENDVWLAFTAGTEVLELEIEPYDCTNGNGIQAAMFETSDCSNFSLVSNCFDAGSPQIFILLASNLTIGNTYYIMIDGKNGDNCNFTFNLLNGNTITPEWAQTEDPVFGCFNEETTLNAQSLNNSAAAEFSWFTNDGNIVSGENSLSPTINTPGTYGFVVTDNTQLCADTAYTTFDFHPDILLNIPTPNVLDCVDNQTVDLNVEISGSDDVYSFSWRNATDVEVGTEQVLTVDAAGVYSVVVINQTTACEKTAQVEVLADVNTPVAIIDPVIDLDCLNDRIEITAFNSSDAPQFVSTWTTADGNILGNNQGLSIEVDEPGTYELNILNTDNGCEGVANIVVNRNDAAPEAILATIQNPCFGEEAGTLQLDSVVNGNPAFTFSLDGSAFSTVTFFENLEPGNYPVTVKDAIGCTYDTVFSIVPQDEITLELGEDFEINQGADTLIKTVVSEENLSYTWLENHSFLSCYDCPNPLATPLKTDYYLLRVENENGCFAEDTLRIYVNEERRIFVANAFSPNDDGVNDFMFVQAGKEVVRISSFRVFDRWGTLLFEAQDFLPNDPSLGFNGIYDGQKLNTSALVWTAQAEYTDGDAVWFSGVTTLIR